MSAFDEAFEVVVGLEGGYINDPNDLGGETKYGISKRYHPNVVIRTLTLGEAKQIYWNEYWNKLLLAQVQDANIATEIFEQAVNLGSVVAVKNAQTSISLIEGSVIVDGYMGIGTLFALNCLGNRKSAFLKCMTALQFNIYRDIVAKNPSQSKFFLGWLKRVNFNG